MGAGWDAFGGGVKQHRFCSQNLMGCIVVNVIFAESTLKADRHGRKAVRREMKIKLSSPRMTEI